MSKEGKMKGVMYFTIITFLLSLIIVLLNSILSKKKTKSEMILELLPGVNCGVCGYGSCSGMSKAILKDKSAIEKCKVLKNKEEILKLLD